MIEALPLDPGSSLVFFTGAGLSSEAGLPVYRGAGGLWHEYRYEEYACQRAFDRDPERVWKFHDERRRVMGAAQPTSAHRRIAELEREGFDVTVVTQNIDGLHQRAGSSRVLELHGSLWRLRCACPRAPREDLRLPLPTHRCDDCGHWLRPDIVWFEDPMPQEPMEAAAEAIMSCEVLVGIGTSGTVYPAAALPRLADAKRARTIEVNPEATHASEFYATHLRMGASEALAGLFPRPGI